MRAPAGEDETILGMLACCGDAYIKALVTLLAKILSELTSRFEANTVIVFIIPCHIVQICIILL